MNTDTSEAWAFSIPCHLLFGCNIRQLPLETVFGRLEFCRRVRHWMQDKITADSLFDQCQKAISSNDEDSFRKIVSQLEDCIDKQKLKAMAEIRWTGMSVEDMRERVIRMIDEGTLQA